jgi:Rps23 Pro-64 3,4-dihydroxylase Tpa1-like proline 4-hydroxylase
MNDGNNISLSEIEVEKQPFPHFTSPNAFCGDTALKIYDWLEHFHIWTLTKTDFYDQYEFNLLIEPIPETFQFLREDATIQVFVNRLKDVFKLPSFKLVGASVHKLVTGQRIAIHNDYINEEETHRLVIHFNPKWKQENGGFLMLFNSLNVEDLSKVIEPLNNLVFGFEISKVSHHAVSKIYDFSRYTIVYTFKSIPGE